MKAKNSSNKMLSPPVKIEPRTFDSKLNTLVCGLTGHLFTVRLRL